MTVGKDSPDVDRKMARFADTFLKALKVAIAVLRVTANIVEDRLLPAAAKPHEA